jgi:alpha-glucosidase
MKALTKAGYRGRESTWAVFDLEHGHELRIGLLEADIGRVVLRRTDGYRLDRGWSIAPGGLEPGYEGRERDDLSGFTLPAAEVSEVDGIVTLSTAGGISVRVRLDPFGIEWHRDGEDIPFLRDRPTQAYFVSRQTNELRHFMARDPAERHYGLGDKSGPLDRTGRRFKIDAVDPCGYDAELSDPLYKMVPMVIVDGDTGAHGIFYDNLAVADVDLGCTIDNYHSYFRSYSAVDGDLDYYVLAGPGVPDVVRRFSWLTGGQAFPPRWSLGFGLTTMTILDAPDAGRRVAAFIDECRQHAIPCESFHFGSGYTSINGRRYAFNWNRDKFPDPAGTLRGLREAGMMPVANLKPCLLDDHPRLHEAEAGGFLVQDGDTGKPAVAQFWDGLGYHLDFTHPAGREWWRDGITAALLDYGMASVWSDNNEYEIWDEDATCDGDGRPFAQILARSAQAMLMLKVSYQAQLAHAPGKRPYVVTRAGNAGTWRYGQTWSGDNETAWKTLRYNLTQGLNMSLTGMFSTGHDVGGFHGPTPDPELFCRFVEFCCLWPRFVMNSWKDNNVVNEPWMHPEVTDRIRDLMLLRRRLMPYYYTQMWRASTANEPVVVPLLYHFPHDPGARGIDDCFMVGPDLLVAPVLEQGETRRSVYLPAHPGGWYDFHTGEHHAGGALADVVAPLGHLPLFVRSGAILPTAEAGEADPVRTLSIFGPTRGTADAILYEDDGEQADWREAGLMLRFALRDGADGRTLSAHHQGSYRPASAALRVRVIDGDPVGIDRAAFPAFLTPAD